MTQQAYPLSWPAGWPRSKFSTTSSFGMHSISECVDEILRQLRLIGAQNVVISSNLILRNDGLPRSGQSQPADAGVAVYFKLNKADRVLACDKWSRVDDNMWAIAKHLDALRGQQRWGVGTIDQAFTGYAALPPAGGAYTQTWWEVLDLPSDLSELNTNAAAVLINSQYRIGARRKHPDAGGSHDAMAQLNARPESHRCSIAGNLSMIPFPTTPTTLARIESHAAPPAGAVTVIPLQPSEYSIWSDPHFWALCEILADICLEQTPQINHPLGVVSAPSSAPSPCATFANQ